MGEETAKHFLYGIGQLLQQKVRASDTVARAEHDRFAILLPDCDLHYVGSITVDPDLLEAGDIREFEQVHVVDIDNGARFETYTIAGERGSGAVKVNGAAACLVHTGDTVILISYAQYDEAELDGYEPTVVHVDRANQIIDVDSEVATLLTPSA